MASAPLSSTVTSLSTFPKFSQLPSELRLQIWQHCVHPRLLRITLGRPLYDGAGKMHYTGRKPLVCQPPPALLSVNRESRDETLRRYTAIERVFKRPFYFNAGIDTLDFNSSGDPHCCIYFLKRLGQKYPDSKVRFLAIDDPAYPCVCFADTVLKWTNLESLVFVSQSCRTYSRRGFLKTNIAYAYQSSNVKAEVGATRANKEYEEAEGMEEQDGEEEAAPENPFLSQRIHEYWVKAFNMYKYSWLGSRKISVKAIQKDYWRDKRLGVVE